MKMLLILLCSLSAFQCRTTQPHIYTAVSEDGTDTVRIVIGGARMTNPATLEDEPTPGSALTREDRIKMRLYTAKELTFWQKVACRLHIHSKRATHGKPTRSGVYGRSTTKPR